MFHRCWERCCRRMAREGLLDSNNGCCARGGSFQMCGPNCPPDPALKLLQEAFGGPVSYEMITAIVVRLDRHQDEIEEVVQMLIDHICNDEDEDAAFRNKFQALTIAKEMVDIVDDPQIENSPSVLPVVQAFRSARKLQDALIKLRTVETDHKPQTNKDMHKAAGDTRMFANEIYKKVFESGLPRTL
eukprot:TRINITY_DN37303_c0_g1_i1.p1 TRINITY_DN37303_c0_g1~~TRINITY_DN37303_c0_g1_i1.p1  ORF type:complete len:187 (-),score=25.23 TRINITY_DN37303_c0_g1_i1:200-760(-)